jgi:hypothetical protein
VSGDVMERTSSTELVYDSQSEALD